MLAEKSTDSATGSAAPRGMLGDNFLSDAERADNACNLRLLMVLVVVGLNLRPLLTSISPLLSDIKAATGMSFEAASMITVLPVLAMGVVALAGARINRLIGDRHGIALSLAAIGTACAGRFFVDSTVPLIFSAGLAGIGVALIQALMPGVIKHNYPTRMTVTMGLYSAAIMGGGGLGAVLSPLSARWFHDWHAGLGIWALPAAFALLLWMMVRNPMPSSTGAARPAARFLHKNKRAWLLGIYFGSINGGYTSMVAWLPAFYMQRGMTNQQSGSLLGLMTAMQVAAAVLLPTVARRGVDRRPWLAFGLLAQLIGFMGLIAGSEKLALLWVSVLGFGLGGTFSLCLILALDHLQNPRHAGELTAFMQGIGFIIAALAPFLTGWIRATTGSFLFAWQILACMAVVLLGVTVFFKPQGYAEAMGEL